MFTEFTSSSYIAQLYSPIWLGWGRGGEGGEWGGGGGMHNIDSINTETCLLFLCN